MKRLFLHINIFSSQIKYIYTLARIKLLVKVKLRTIESKSTQPVSVTIFEMGQGQGDESDHKAILATILIFQINSIFNYVRGQMSLIPSYLKIVNPRNFNA